MILLGQSATVTRRFDAADLAAFRALGGAEAVRVPEPLIGALFSYLMGMHLPGPGTNYLKQSTRFLAPAPLGTPLTATVTVTRLRTDKRLVDLETTCRLPDGRLIAAGRALVAAGDVASGWD
ncbi:MAG: phosphate acetyltransferase [Gemmobacter sp.]